MTASTLTGAGTSGMYLWMRKILLSMSLPCNKLTNAGAGIRQPVGTWIRLRRASLRTYRGRFP